MPRTVDDIAKQRAMASALRGSNIDTASPSSYSGLPAQASQWYQNIRDKLTTKPVVGNLLNLVLPEAHMDPVAGAMAAAIPMKFEYGSPPKGASVRHPAFINRLTGTVVETPGAHDISQLPFDPSHKGLVKNIMQDWVDGFTTNSGHFVTRDQAHALTEAGNLGWGNN